MQLEAYPTWKVFLSIDIRISLEKLAVEKCIERSTDEDIAAISNSLKEFEKAVKQKNYDPCNQLDNEFHFLIAQMSKKQSLSEFIKRFVGFFSAGP